MPGLLRGIARTTVVAGTATAVSNRVSRRQAGRWAAQDQGPAAYASGDDTSDRLAQLQQLGALKAQGVLTEAEFEQQKARILGACSLRAVLRSPNSPRRRGVRMSVAGKVEAGHRIRCVDAGAGLERLDHCAWIFALGSLRLDLCQAR